MNEKKIPNQQQVEIEKEYLNIMRTGNRKFSLNTEAKRVDWQHGETFELFSLFNNVNSGATSSDSYLTNNTCLNA
ncbi:hypothetical protein SAMN05444410_11684 [Hydrobacter penzbergensis]|uniref:Uncharacterized protein n=1 Tax=Hydrobacter penzbergensis TaxID=1235997 RepID=A0A8X8IHW9_9BACT|nr:hypothetical protein [Hydrobacter penzbergensis]SDX46112.1 hypothetical protein SAMN05444410_11684 [Hydrobacter penzbergensis]